ncbi:MAG: YbhB/YbcL family Raf kinase inhibitor-like protein [Thermoanaerobaculia bacterium]|nr:YbhB/YbcL family Raf kinase inhibitor-like protein [Thermoanaerobaculia bacterium]
MKLHISAFDHGSPIPDEYAMFNIAEEGHVTPGGNRNPEIRWANVPEGTKSLALIVIDTDAPTVGDDVNQEGRTVPEDLPRTDFHHWVLVDIDPGLERIEKGSASDGVTAGGKPTGETEHGVTGQNDYTGWFSGDEEMGGIYGGYDGPAPPWNDARIHNYTFRLYALDVDSLGLTGSFDAGKALEAMEGHVIATADHVGRYSLNPSVRNW